MDAWKEAVETLADWCHYFDSTGEIVVDMPSSSFLGQTIDWPLQAFAGLEMLFSSHPVVLWVRVY